MENQYRFVDFKKYCETCKHKKLKENLDPCCECLDECVNVDSEKPVYYEEAEK